MAAARSSGNAAPKAGGYAAARYGWLGVLLCAIPLGTLYMVSVIHNSIPWGDDVSLLREMRFDQGLAWTRLFRFHNEHQIVFTKLVVFADYALFRGANILPCVVAVLLALFVPLTYCAAFRFLSQDPPEKEGLLLLSGVLLALYMNANLLWTLTTPILLQHLFSAAFAVTAAFGFSYAALAKAGSGKRRLALAAFWVSAGLAVLSGAGGLLILPTALIVTAVFFTDWELVRRITRWRLMGSLLLCFLGIAAVYFFSWRRSRGGATGVLSAVDWVGLAKFVVLFIGGSFWRESTWPLPYHPNRVLVALTCLTFCGLLCWLLVRLLRARERVTPLGLFQVFIIVFVLLTAFAGAWNRAHLGAAEGLNRKYPPTSLLAWLAAASLMIAYRPAGFFGRPRTRSLRPLLVSVLAVVLILPGQVIEFHVWRYWLDRLEETAAMVASGVYDELRLRHFYYDSSVPFSLATDVLRPQGAYFLRRMPAIPYPAGNLYEIHSTMRPSWGWVTHLDFVSQRAGFSGYLANGVLSESIAFPRLKSALVVDSNGYAVGYGHVSQVTAELRILPRTAPRQPRGWFAAFRNPQNSPHVTVYALDGRKLREIARIQLKPGEPAASEITVVDEILDHTDYGLDQFNEVLMPLIKPPVRVPYSGSLVLRGWAVDRHAQKPAGAVEVEINGKAYVCSYGADRADVAAYFNQPAYRHSGFALDLPAAQVGKGKHELHVRVISADRKTCRRSAVFRFEVE